MLQRWAAMRLLEFMLIFELVALRILVIGTTVRPFRCESGYE
jgi:hypothetical protein